MGKTERWSLKKALERPKGRRNVSTEEKRRPYLFEMAGTNTKKSGKCLRSIMEVANIRDRDGGWIHQRGRD